MTKDIILASSSTCSSFIKIIRLILVLINCSRLVVLLFFLYKRHISPFVTDSIKKIIITGSKKEFLYQTEQIFYEYCQDLILEQIIEIIIEDNIKKLNTINSDVKIISLDNIGSIYLNKLNNHSCEMSIYMFILL